MRPLTNLAWLVSATMLGAALASTATAQATSGPRYEVRPFVGAYVPTGDQRDLLDDAIALGAQGAVAITNNLSVLGTLAWSRSTDKTKLFLDDVFHYDVGAEYRHPFTTTNGMTLAPFVGLGIGGRTYDYSDRATEAETNLAGYGAVGGQLSVGAVGLRLEARDRDTLARRPDSPIA
jgi:hypothetical protein